MATQKMFRCLRDGELYIYHPAVAKYHDKKADPLITAADHNSTRSFDKRMYQKKPGGGAIAGMVSASAKPIILPLISGMSEAN